MQGTPGPQAERFGASPAAIAVHYDLSDDFFRLVLGREMVYSCALFREGDDIATAQTRKLDHHISEAAARGAARVLDIGCGWGALLTRLVTEAGVGHAVGLPLSPSQAAWIRRTQSPSVEVREEDWRDHKPNQKYDAIISIGAFEHCVRRHLDPAQKASEYREFFKF